MCQDSLGATLKELRKARGLTQEVVAERIGIARSALVQIENGRRKLTAIELLRLAELFKMPVEQFVDPSRRPQISLEEGEARPERPEAIRVSVPQSRVSKFREVLLYILIKVGAQPHVGETVLYKLLYFIDFDHYEKYEEQLVGAKYIKNRYGPTPTEFHKIVEQMEQAGDIETVKSHYFSYPQTKYLPRRVPNLAELEATEVATIESVLRRLGDMNAAQISEYSHKDVPWIVTDEGKPIEYETVFYRTPEYSVREATDSEESISD